MKGSSRLIIVARGMLNSDSLIKAKSIFGRWINPEKGPQDILAFGSILAIFLWNGNNISLDRIAKQKL